VIVDKSKNMVTGSMPVSRDAFINNYSGQVVCRDGGGYQVRFISGTEPGSVSLGGFLSD
jgi:hypothetical protein